MAPFLAAISGMTIHDLTIEPARLEEAFLEFYAPDVLDDADDGTDGRAGPTEARGTTAVST